MTISDFSKAHWSENNPVHSISYVILNSGWFQTWFSKNEKFDFLKIYLKKFELSGSFRQTSADKDERTAIFLKIRTDTRHLLSKFRTADMIENDRNRTYSHRTENRTKIGQQTNIGQNFPENPDKNETMTGNGHRCPSTSAFRNEVWNEPIKSNHFSF